MWFLELPAIYTHALNCSTTLYLRALYCCTALTGQAARPTCFARPNIHLILYHLYGIHGIDQPSAQIH